MLSSCSQFPFTVALLFVFFAGTRLDAKPVIVDDADTSKVTYSSGWNIGNNCTTCFAQPDGTQASGGTWHDATASVAANLSFTFTFTGTSVEAWYIAVDTTEPEYVATAGTSVSYSVDGVQLWTFVRNPASRNSYIYNQSLLSVTALTNGKHTLRVDLLRPSVLLLDYIIYDDGSLVTSPPTTTSLPSSTLLSVPSPTNSTSSADGQTTTSVSGSSQNLGSIIGGVVGAVFVLLLGVVLAWYFLKRRRSGQTSSKINDLSSPQFLPPSAQPELHQFTSHFDAPADTTSQEFYKYPQTSPTATSQHSTTSHAATNTSTKMGPNLSGASLTGVNVIPAPSASRAPSMIPLNISSTTIFSSSPSVSEAHRGSRVDDRPPLVLPPYSLQAPTTSGAPPSNLSTNVARNLAPTQTPDEPVEQGLMSTQT